MIFNKRNLSLLVSFFIIVFKLHSQVTIGSGYKPNEGTLLDLKEAPNGTAQKGLNLPRVKLSNLTPSTPDELAASIGSTGTWDLDKHIGLVVYNIANREVDHGETCPGLHVWDGIKWQPIVPYGDVLEQKTLSKVENRNFEYLESDPTHVDFNPNLWPADKQAAAQNGNYILGNSKTQQITDIEGNEYYTSRFYVGYKTRVATYTIKRNYNCNATAEPTWTDEGSIKEIEKIFTDGVWTTEHLRTMTLPNGTAIPKHLVNSDTEPQYFIPNNNSEITRKDGLLYNWAAAINMGDGTNQTTINPGNIDQGGSSNDDVLVQGICPNGWYLPSDQDFTDLENGIILKTSIFSSTTDIVEPLIAYDTKNNRGPAHGIPMIISATPSTLASSKPAAEGGFANYLCGYAGNGGSIYTYGTSNYIWSASNCNSSSSWRRGLGNGSSNIARYNGGTTYLLSVRCKKKDQ